MNCVVIIATGATDYHNLKLWFPRIVVIGTCSYFWRVILGGGSWSGGSWGGWKNCYHSSIHAFLQQAALTIITYDYCSVFGGLYYERVEWWQLGWLEELIFFIIRLVILELCIATGATSLSIIINLKLWL